MRAEEVGAEYSLPTFKEQQTDDMIRIPRGTSVLQHNIGCCSKLLISSVLILMLASQQACKPSRVARIVAYCSEL